MNLEKREESTMGELLKDFDVKRIKSGDILKGIVIDADEKEVRVNINYAFDGVISREELTNTDDSPLEVVKPGDEIDVYVLSPNDGEGYVQLSRVRALQITEREELEEAYKNEMKNLKDGEYSKEPVKTSYGYHIVYRIDQKEKPALEDIKDQIKEEIADEKISNDKNLYYVVLDKMRENANLKFEDTVLKDKYDNYMSQYK